MDISLQGIHEVMENSWRSFLRFRNSPVSERTGLMRAIATRLENSGDSLIHTAMRETNLPEARLKNERLRTVFQLRSYADACEQGYWLDARIDTALPDRNPPRPDIRKMNTAIGPVIVFGASNFPFAYSTAGGDTASALAAGCTVVVKAHPAHPSTSDAVAAIIAGALEETGTDPYVFQHVHGASFEIGKALVMHERTKAVGFTGSFAGGKQLYDWAQLRPEPIPVFAEMGSVNPVFLLPEKLRNESSWLADQLSGSITLGAGQFCTNPGLMFALESDSLDSFVTLLSERISGTPPARMLHTGIHRSYNEKKEITLSQADVELIATSSSMAAEMEATPTIACVSGDTFMANPLLHKEVFGPFSLIVKCRDKDQMLALAGELEGQLTCSIMGTVNDFLEHHELGETLTLKCGRMIMNGVPTGVEVCWSMQHGGPFPSTTDARFGSVGPDAIKRFVRPLSFQNFPDLLLPEALKTANPLQIPRIENGKTII